MRLSDLTKNLSNMSQEELLAHVRQIRDNKYVVKPAVQKRVADVEKKVKNTGIRSMDKMIDGMTDEQKLALLKSLQSQGGTTSGN